MFVPAEVSLAFQPSTPVCLSGSGLELEGGPSPHRLVFRERGFTVAGAPAPPQTPLEGEVLLF